MCVGWVEPAARVLDTRLLLRGLNCKGCIQGAGAGPSSGPTLWTTLTIRENSIGLPMGGGGVLFGKSQQLSQNAPQHTG